MSKKNSTPFDLSGYVETKPGVFEKKPGPPQPRDQKTGLGKKLPEILKEQKLPEKGPAANLIATSTTDTLVFKWGDKDISLNQWYSQKHWDNRYQSQKEWHEFFSSFMLIPYPKFEAYTMVLEYNSRLDPTNTITMIKLCEDTLRKLGVIQDDTGEYCKRIQIIPNQMMKRRSYKLTVKHIQ